MNHISLLRFSLLALGLTATSLSAKIQIDTVEVGHPNNPADTITMNDGTSGYGSVPYSYRIGKYLVTKGQYTAFLNAVAKDDPHGLYQRIMGRHRSGGIIREGEPGSYTYTVGPSPTDESKDMSDYPVNYVTFLAAARFANWLMNGQPTGPAGPNTTESGVYLFDEEGNLVGQRERAGGPIDGRPWVAVASENEWYKAAYFDPTLNEGVGGYWLYPTRSNEPPTPGAPNAESTNAANIPGSRFRGITPVGSYPASVSYFGTQDQAGLLAEINDSEIGRERGLRGGSYQRQHALGPAANTRGSILPTMWGQGIGFRITSSAPIQ